MHRKSTENRVPRTEHRVCREPTVHCPFKHVEQELQRALAALSGDGHCPACKALAHVEQAARMLKRAPC